ncbi:ankyrin repeat domain-containing protein 27 [Nematostella vectensis]|uniref:ankyrin repeat domain-containing protein 27 n=1 Tax=Nematostella vectensis TaxID=45351 RepID=UPI0013902D54|nr:ankyrin repeat domain-containing protein 27 [Nematostella vectensis]
MAEDVHIEGYDEDLVENSFFKYIQNKHKPLYEEATEQRWTICIPRIGTLSRSNHTLQDVENHILKTTDKSSSSYKTLNDKTVQVNEGFIVTTEGFKDVKSVRILFEETFFNKENESYHVLCLDQPLEGGVGVSAEPVIQTLEHLQGCVDFLWPSTGTKQGQKQIDEIIQLFNSTYQQLEGESLRHLMDAANAIYTRAMQAALKNWQLRKLAKSNKSYLDNVKLAIETYVMHGLHSQLMKGISAIFGNEDAALNKTTRNLAEIQIRDLEIKPELCQNLPRARRILSLLNKFTSPLEKFHCLKKSITMVTERKLKESEQGTEDVVTADDLLPALVFLVIKSDIPNWLANIIFLHNFHFSKCGYSEFQFYLSSVEAAVEHVRSGYVSKEFKGGAPFKRLTNGMSGLLWQHVDHDTAKPTALDELFEFAAIGNEQKVMGLLASKQSDKARLEKMCHPLCSCDKCEKLLSRKRNDPSAVTVFSRDDMGRTVLHVATEFGHANLTYALIHEGAVVNAMDYHGTTPLHLACLRGHSRVVLLLLHYNADANAPDNDGNTPLHLCAANGHGQCLKSMLYWDMRLNVLKMNEGNENGDTPLHLAARWGYVDIVEQLIEKGASVQARNKNRNTPQQCAYNQQVSDILEEANPANNDIESDFMFVDKTSRSLDIPVGPTQSSLVGSAASSLERSPVKEVDVFLRTVADGDLAMVRYRLGVDEDEEDEEGEERRCRSEQDLCHPLCQCDKCSKWQKLTQRSLARAVHANCTNADGITPLHVAAVRGYEDITSLLLRHGANPSHRDTRRQQTALHLACQYNHANVVELLLNHKAKINVKDCHGNTPLHFCCINGHVGPAIVLLQCKANVDVVNDRGNTPLHEAARWNFVELVRLLLRYRASVIMRNKMQLTPMQYAKHDDVIKVLEDAKRWAASLSARSSSWTGSATKQASKAESLEVQGIVSGSPPKKKISDSHVTRSVQTSSTSAQPKRTGPGTVVYSSKTGLDGSHVGDPVASSRPRAVSDESMCDTSIAAPQTKMSQIFEQLEGGEIEKLQKIAKAVRAFDRRKSLKHIVTVDKSSPMLTLHQQQGSVDFDKTGFFKPLRDERSSRQKSSAGRLLEQVRRSAALQVDEDVEQESGLESRLERVRRIAQGCGTDDAQDHGSKGLRATADSGTSAISDSSNSSSENEDQLVGLSAANEKELERQLADAARESPPLQENKLSSYTDNSQHKGFELPSTDHSACRATEHAQVVEPSHANMQVAGEEHVPTCRKHVLSETFDHKQVDSTVQVAAKVHVLPGSCSLTLGQGQVEYSYGLRDVVQASEGTSMQVTREEHAPSETFNPEQVDESPEKLRNVEQASEGTRMQVTREKHVPFETFDQEQVDQSPNRLQSLVQASEAACMQPAIEDDPSSAVSTTFGESDDFTVLVSVGEESVPVEQVGGCGRESDQAQDELTVVLSVGEVDDSSKDEQEKEIGAGKTAGQVSLPPTLEQVAEVQDQGTVLRDPGPLRKALVQDSFTQDSQELVTQDLEQESVTHERDQVFVMQGTEQEPVTQDSNQEPVTQDLNQESVTQDSTQEPVTQDSNQESVTQDSTQEPVTQDSTQEPVTQDSNQESVTQDSNQEPVAQDSTQEPVTQDSTQEPVTQDSTQEPVTQDSTQEPVTQDSTQEPVTQDSTQEPVTQDSTQEPVTQDSTQESVTQDSTQESANQNSELEGLTQDSLPVAPSQYSVPEG